MALDFSSTEFPDEVIEAAGCAPVMFVYLDYVVPAIAGIAGASIFPALFAFIRAYTTGKIKVFRTMFWIGIAFFVLCIAIYITFIPMVSLACHDMMASMQWMMTCMQIYTLSTLLLLSQLHYRLYAILKETEVRVSRIINIAMGTYYVLASLSTLVSVILFWAGVPMVSMRVLVTVMICDVTIAGLLDALFIYKIWRAMQYSKDKLSNKTSDNRFKMVVTKAGLLAFWATATTIGCFAVDQLRQSVPWVHWALIFHVVFIFDVYTNFVCIWLSYVYFNNYYIKACRPCHACCQACWFGVDDIDDFEKKMRHMHVTSESEITNTTAKLQVYASATGTGSASAGDPKEKVRKWLTKVVRLPEYIDLFMNEGYDDMVTVQTLTDTELKEMGISKRGHRKKILIFADEYKQRKKRRQHTPGMGSYSPSPDPSQDIEMLDVTVTSATNPPPPPLSHQVTVTAIH